MSDKPEKIWLIQMDDRNLVWCDSPDPTNGNTIPDEDRTEYLRADLAKPSEWISVDDRLPERNSTVLLYDRMFDKCMVVDINFKPELMDGDITHWQPLPSPPTRETS